MSPALPTGTVTFLFTDIEGSTRLLQHLGDTYGTVLGEHQALLRQAFTRQGGVEIDTQGDGFFVAFPTAPAAVAAAAAATRALAAHPWPQDAVLLVRMGLHTGSPQLVGDRYVGLDVHRAARIAAAGHGGQILLSASTRVLAAQDLPERVTLRELGTYRLKDLQHPEPITQLVLAELPSDFPPLKTLDRRAHNLPIQPTVLLGREEQVSALSALLGRPDVRLVTVTGAGGIGKTRLAMQVAAEVLEPFPDGVWFVRLSRLVDPELVLSTIAQTLGLKEVAGQPIAQTLAEHLHEKQLLLLLDNFEQVVTAAPEIGELLAENPGLKVLVTSRVPLRLRGEHDYALMPLPLPESGVLPSPERLTQYAAVALFVERASAAQADFTVTASNAPAIAEICARLDGLPLAIELAATRVTLLSPEALLSRLSSQLQLLTGGARDLEARQQTMRATIAWSVALLRPHEQELFRRLAVFVGGGTLEAIEAVCMTQGGAVSSKTVEGAGADLLDTMGILVDQSLVQRRQEGGELRLGMRHVIREYAIEQLAESGETWALQESHGAYYLSLAEQLEPQLQGSSQIELFARLEREHDNLRAVLAWSLEHGAAETAARLCVALHPFLNMAGHWIEEEQCLAQAVSLDNELPPRLRARLHGTAGYVSRSQGDYTAATRHFEESLALFRSVDDTAGVGDVLGQLAVLAFRQESFERAEQLFEESLGVLRQIGDRMDMVYVLRAQAELPLARGHLAAARSIIEQALGLAESLGVTHDIAECKARMGWLALLEGGDASAEALVEGALQVQRQLNDANCSAHSLGYLGLLALERGDVVTAQSRLAESLARYTDVANQQGIAEAQVRLGMARVAGGTVKQAKDAYQAGLLLAQRLKNKQSAAAGLAGLAEIALAERHPERAARLLGAAVQALASIGAAPLPLPPRLRVERQQVAATAQDALGEAAWKAAFAAGEALPLDDAITEALTSPQP
jgi:predicted ATPase/class 3 adenylate cyclase